jgi:hypothetical protein
MRKLPRCVAVSFAPLLDVWYFRSSNRSCDSRLQRTVAAIRGENVRRIDRRGHDDDDVEDEDHSFVVVDVSRCF